MWTTKYCFSLAVFLMLLFVESAAADIDPILFQITNSQSFLAGGLTNRTLRASDSNNSTGFISSGSFTSHLTYQASNWDVDQTATVNVRWGDDLFDAYVDVSMDYTMTRNTAGGFWSDAVNSLMTIYPWVPAGDSTRLVSDISMYVDTGYGVREGHFNRQPIREHDVTTGTSTAFPAGGTTNINGTQYSVPRFYALDGIGLIDAGYVEPFGPGATHHTKRLTLEMTYKYDNLNRDRVVTCEEILTGGLSHTIDAATGALALDFVPQFQYSLADAASRCGVHHFNWRNTFSLTKPAGAPVRITEWRGIRYDPNLDLQQIFDDVQQAMTQGVPHPITIMDVVDAVDPVVDPDTGFYVVIDDTGPATSFFPIDHRGADSLEPYWNELDRDPEIGLLADYTFPSLLLFLDNPALPANLVQSHPGLEYFFTTELVGVNASGEIVRSWNDIGTNATWRSNRTIPANGGGAHDVAYTYSNADTTPTVVDGRIYDVRYDLVPEPGTSSLLVCGWFIITFGRRFSRWV